MSMEGAKIYDRPEMDRYAWRRHKFYSTTSFQSEIPLPYSSSEEYNIWDAVPVDYDTAIFGVVFVARNCVRSNDRERLVVHLRRLAKSRRCCNRQGSYKQHKQQPRQFLLLFLEQQSWLPQSRVDLRLSPQCRLATRGKFLRQTQYHEEVFVL